MSLINSPPTNAVDRLGKGASGYTELLGVADGWRNFFNAVYAICNGLSQSGTTANRPTSGLWIGRMYFDTTLGIPVWVDSYAAGVAVWVDATGAPA